MDGARETYLQLLGRGLAAANGISLVELSIRRPSAEQLPPLPDRTGGEDDVEDDDRSSGGSAELRR